MDKQSEFPQVSEIFFALCKSVNTAFSLGAWLRFKYDHKLYLDVNIRPEDYESAEAFKLDYLVSVYLSKSKCLDTGYDLEAEAIQRFKTSEDHCLKTNVRLKNARNCGVSPTLSSVISTAKRKISSILGPYSTFKVCDSYGWGPGATSDISRRKAFVDTKLCQTPLTVTPKALPIIRQEIGADLHWSAVLLGVDVADIVGNFCFLRNVFAVTDECVIDTVPKNSKTHRVIAKENTCNGFLQKGFGAYFRSRLKRVGIDLDDQSLNQEAAKAAFSQRLATLDLKAASDSVAIELVYELFPIDWAFALDDVRSPKAKMPDGSTITLQKFSSMGNGFTFELESLIFWALASSVTDLYHDSSRVWIYGDDIVCPADSAATLIEVLEFCGFTVNTEKSSVSGNFYESCGKHYFKGFDVTPVYQKEAVDNVQELIRCANRLIRCAHRFGSYDSLCKRIYPAWARAWRYAGPSSIYQLPLGTEGDDGWIVGADYFTVKPQDPNLGIRCTVIPSRTVSLPGNDRALLAWTLRRGVKTQNPFLGNVTSSPDTTKSSALGKSGRWVMPTWEFGLSW